MLSASHSHSLLALDSLVRSRVLFMEDEDALKVLKGERSSELGWGAGARGLGTEGGSEGWWWMKVRE